MALQSQVLDQIMTKLAQPPVTTRLSDDQIKLWDLERDYRCAQILLTSSQEAAEYMRQRALTALGTLTRLEVELEIQREKMGLKS